MNCSLDTVIQLDNYRFKLLKSQLKLTSEHHRLQNYQQTIDYATRFIGCCNALLKEYGHIVINPEDDDGSVTTNIKYLRPKYLKRVMRMYYDSRAHVCGDFVYKQLSDIEINYNVDLEIQHHKYNDLPGESNYLVHLNKKYLDQLKKTTRLANNIK